VLNVVTSCVRCQINLEIRTTYFDTVVLNGFWKQFYLVAIFTYVTTALEDFCNEMRFLNVRFNYLLTYL